MNRHRNGDGMDLVEAVFRMIHTQLAIVRADEARCGRAVTIAEQLGPVAVRADHDFITNRRVALQVPPLAELWFVAWGPDVLVQVRHHGAGPVTDFAMDQLTPEFVLSAAMIFLNGLTPDDLP